MIAYDSIVLVGFYFSTSFWGLQQGTFHLQAKSVVFVGSNHGFLQKRQLSLPQCLGDTEGSECIPYIYIEHDLTMNSPCTCELVLYMFVCTYGWCFERLLDLAGSSQISQKEQVDGKPSGFRISWAGLHYVCISQISVSGEFPLWLGITYIQGNPFLKSWIDIHYSEKVKHMNNKYSLINTYHLGIPKWWVASHGPGVSLAGFDEPFCWKH